MHPSIVFAHIAIQVFGWLVEEGAFQISPALDHSGKKFGAAWIKSRIKTDRNPQFGGSGGKVCIRSGQEITVGKMALKRDVVPLGDLFWIQVVDHRKGVKLVETGSYITIFNVRETAQVNNEIGTAALASQFVTRSLHIAIGQSEAFAGPAQPRARLHFRRGKFSRVCQAMYCHATRYLSVMFPEQ